MRRGLGPLLVLLAVPALAAGPAPATPQETEAAMRTLAQQVGEIAGKQQGVLDRLDLLKRRIRLDEMVLARVQQQQTAGERAVRKAESRLQALSEKETEARRYLSVRVRQQYALGLLQQYRVYFAVSSTQDLRSASYYLDYLGRRDAQQLQAVRTLKDEQEKVRAGLADARTSLEAQARDAAQEKENLLAEQGRLAALLAQLGRERQTAQLGLDETLKAARAMDRYVSDLAFHSSVEMYSKNMATARGTLPFPCNGPVVKGFGDYVHPRFKTRVPHPGLDIAAPLGAPVKAVFDGQVEFADWLSGYGYTVILSHPGGYFTIYGHLDQILVTKGATVSQGQVLGRVGESAATATTALYFELRQGGKALDPAGWLKGASHVSNSDR